jgi:3alpha(or 20beta)-hydroxysteroid dehydrogenase
VSGVDGRVVLITGAAGGLGAAQARRLVADGANVVVADIDEAGVKALAEELNDGTGTRAAAVVLDVRDADAWAAAVERARTEFGKLDGLVNNAGVLGIGTVADMPVDDFRAVVEVNQTGVFLGIQAVVPALRAAGGGTIVNISSIDGMIGFKYLSAYCASKAAVLAISKTAAMELGPEGIRVNSVCPGVIETPMTDGLDANVSKWLHRTLPLRRLGTPPEVAAVVAFLTSSDSSYVTGAEIVTDGGLLSGFLIP